MKRCGWKEGEKDEERRIKMENEGRGRNGVERDGKRAEHRRRRVNGEEKWG